MMQLAARMTTSGVIFAAALLVVCGTASAAESQTGSGSMLKDSLKVGEWIREATVAGNSLTTLYVLERRANETIEQNVEGRSKAMAAITAFRKRVQDSNLPSAHLVDPLSLRARSVEDIPRASDEQKEEIKKLLPEAERLRAEYFKWGREGAKEITAIHDTYLTVTDGAKLYTIPLHAIRMIVRDAPQPSEQP